MSHAIGSSARCVHSAPATHQIFQKLQKAPLTNKRVFPSSARNHSRELGNQGEYHGAASRHNRQCQPGERELQQGAILRSVCNDSKSEEHYRQQKAGEAETENLV